MKALGPRGMEHVATLPVSYSGYVRGCRCAECSTANSDYGKERRAKLRAGIPLGAQGEYRPPVHHAIRLTAPERLNWRLQGACLEHPVEFFFVPKGASAAEAKRVCATCPVIAQCRAEAVSDPSISGIWGGTSERERMKIRREAVA